jgi:hypothetical protein
MKAKPEFHGVRRRRSSGALLGSLLLASAGLAACGDYHGEESPELQAILDDGDLGDLMARSSALSTPTPGAPRPGTGSGTGAGTGAAGTSPAMVGAAGTSGSAVGFAGSGGPSTGKAGSGPFPTGMAGSFGVDGGVGPTRSFPGQAMAFWRFDDCNMNRTELGDSTFGGGHTAFRSVSAFCRPGVSSSGVGFDENDDIVVVPDQPNFVFSEGFTVAAWVKPTDLGGVRTIFRKRLDGTSAFVLAENGKNFQIVINLGSGKAADLQVKAPLDTFTHVAATFDGVFLKLYINGQEAASKRVVGRLADGFGPLLMGNDASNRRIDGVIDNVLFDTVPATPAEILKLTCLPRPSQMVVTPVDPAPVGPGTPVNYDVQFTNNSCDDSFFSFNTFNGGFDPNITVSPQFGSSAAPADVTIHLPFSATASEDLENFGTTQIFVNGNFQSQTFEFFQQAVNFTVVDNSTPCTIKPRRELEIRDVSVVDDPVRTGPGGAWTFGKLMEKMAPTPEDAPAMVEGMLTSFLTQQTVNGFTLPARPGIQQVLDSMRGPDGKLDLSRQAFRLLAIANRIDLNDASTGTAGEGRFVFGFAPFGSTLSATLIIEYGIPAGSQAEIVDLAKAWHALRALPFPSEDYNAALEKVTDRFAARGVAPGRPNGSALAQIRTNDFFTFSFAWEFREFHLDASSGMLVPAPVALTPDRSFNFSPLLTQFVAANEPAILDEKHTVPPTFQGVPFQGGNVDASDFFTWQVPGVSAETRHRFARNTCNGCHTFSETGGDVFQVSPRGPFQESTLSGFLTGANVDDPAAGVTRHFRELNRRGRILHDLVCPEEMLPPPPPDTTPIGGGGFDGGFAGTGGGMVPPPPSTDGGFPMTTGAAGAFGGK